MPKPLFALDPRWFQVVFQFVFLCYGVMFLHWEAEWLHYSISILGCIVFQSLFEIIKSRALPSLTRIKSGCFSVLISAMSLCLLLKTNHWYTSLLATFLTVGGKYIFRFNGKHVFNPSAFGIIATLIISGDAWLSPGQWGSNAVIFFLVITFGTIVVTRVQKLDISLTFILVFGVLLFWRQVLVLGWGLDFFIHSLTSGALLLFTFFMISDPKTAPNHPRARIFWAILIAAISFYLSAFKWKYNTPIWVLVATAPLVPVLDSLFKARAFIWQKTGFHWAIIDKFKKPVMRSLTKKWIAFMLLTIMISQQASAFCGFYVSKADGTLKNKTSQVILVRDGQKTVITMFNDFKGNFNDFAMVVPVPVVLKEKDIKVVDQRIFDVLNDYSKPRLVEYYDANPCQQYDYEFKTKVPGVAMAEGKVRGNASFPKDMGVKIEAKYLVGEYDILILSAKESSGLKEWLTLNGYKIPAGAEEVLEPYIKSNLKFFVVKVNENELKKMRNNFLRPIQISFQSPKFMLPIRLGMANADGDQDMIIYAFTKKGRIECTNYRTVEIPTSKNIPLFVKNNFGNFYSNLFGYQWSEEGENIAMLEYAWDVSPQNYVKCDPCVSNPPAMQDLVQAGVWWISRNWENYDDVYGESDYSNNVYFTRLHVRYNRKAFPQDLMFQLTPNTENFQARYIVTHSADGDFNCEAGKKYLKALKERRKEELDMLTYLTGKSYDDWDLVNIDEKQIPQSATYHALALNKKRVNHWIIAGFGIMGLVSLVRWKRLGAKRY